MLGGVQIHMGGWLQNDLSIMGRVMRYGVMAFWGGLVLWRYGVMAFEEDLSVEYGVMALWRYYK